MTPSETVFDPDDDEVQYDLAGNPLPRKPKAAAAPPPGGYAAPTPAFTPPPGAFTPPPGAFTPPPGAAPYAAPPPAKTGGGPGLYLGLGGGLIVLLGLIFGLSALKPKTVAAPASYSTYTAIDNSFSCDKPAGWDMHETGATNGNLATVRFENGHARVRVISDATGSVMGDIQSAGNANLPPEQQVPAVQKLHMQDVAVLANDLPGYQEKDPETFQSAFGDSRVSEWTADGDQHGYRATMLSHERELTVICFCPERNWAMLKPSFQHMIRAVKPSAAPAPN